MYSNDKAIYQIAKDKDVYYLNPYAKAFELPEKVYGKLDVLASRFWRTFSLSNKSMGAMFTGTSGSGKTTLAELLGNFGLANGFNVVLVTDLNADIELVRFIDRLERCVIVFDEFAKNFDYKLQDKMLTMFNDLSRSKKFFIITENDSKDINQFLRNRPGRIRYHVDFKRIKEFVIEDYCIDMQIDFNSSFYKDLLEVYGKALTFSFDHLQALVDEHKKYPDDTLEELIEVLNLEILTKEEKLSISKCIDVSDSNDIKEVELDDSNVNMDKKAFDSGRSIWIYPKLGQSICITKNDVIAVTDDIITCVVNNKYEVTLNVA